MDLLQARTDFDVFVEAGEYRAAFGADGSGDDHAVGFDAAKFARRQIRDHGDLAADQFFRLVVLRDAGANLANFRADVHSQLQQLVCPDDAFGGLDLSHAHFDFGEILNADFLRRGLWGGRGPAGTRARSGWRDHRFLRFIFHRFHPLYGFLMFYSWKHGFNRPDSSPCL